MLILAVSVLIVGVNCQCESQVAFLVSFTMFLSLEPALRATSGPLWDPDAADPRGKLEVEPWTALAAGGLGPRTPRRWRICLPLARGEWRVRVSTPGSN